MWLMINILWEGPFIYRICSYYPQLPLHCPGGLSAALPAQSLLAYSVAKLSRTIVVMVCD